MRAPIGLLSVVGSFGLTFLVLGNAYLQKKQFYPSVVYITKSNPSMAVLYIQAFVFVIILAKLMRKIFFGQLRAVEMEHLIERSWYAVTETCLAFTVFRDDFSTNFVVMFTLLLLLKCFHWLAEDRIDYMESSPMITWLFHIRAICLMSFLVSLDITFIDQAYRSTLTKGASVQLVFGFEYAILTTVVAAIAFKYVLHLIDSQSEIAWENKAVYLLYTELVVGGVKVLLYSSFMVIMIKVHTFPLFAIRPMYLTLRSFKKALNDVVMSRRAIRNMNNLYPDATAEDLQSGDNVCIICREEMSTGCKKLPCNHIFHTSCLRSWFQRQQTCPTCRMDVLRNPRPQTDQQQQQQPQQQQQQQQQPAQLQQMQMNQFNGFPFWPQPGVFPQPQPPAQSGSLPPSPTPGTASDTLGPPGSTANVTNMPAFMAPPFMMPFSLPFSTPMPTPPADFSGLTDQEVLAMEGTERSNVEARIQCLRNIQVLLDAAVLQMNQYSQVMSSLQQTTSPSPAPSVDPTPDRNILPTSAMFAATTPLSATSPVDPRLATSVGDMPTGIGTSAATESSLRTDELEGAVGYTPEVSTDSREFPYITSLEESINENVEELRRRRLHRFSQSAKDGD